MTTAITSALGQVLAELSAIFEPRPGLRSPSRPESFLELDDQLAILARRLDLLLPAAPELQSIVDRVRLDRDAPFIAVEPLAIVFLSTRVWRANEVVVRVGPLLVRAAQLAEPTRWLPLLSDTLTRDAEEIRSLYAKAIATAWDPVGGWESVLRAADDASSAFALRVTNLYINDLRGLRSQIVKVGELRDDLLAVKQSHHRPLPATPSFNDVALSAEANGQWLPQAQLTADWNALQGSWANHLSDTRTRLDQLTRRLQALMLTITALTADDELETIVDELIAWPDLKARLNSYRGELALILTQLHDGFLHPAGPSQASAGGALTILLTRPEFVDDVTHAVSVLGWQATAKAIALGAVVIAAAAITGGAAGYAAGVTVGAIAGEATVLGITWVAVGSFAVEAIAFTLVDRFGREVIFGPESLRGSSFWEDLFWNAAMFGMFRAIEAGFGRLFLGVKDLSYSARLSKFAVEQISMAGFVAVQHAIRTGNLIGLNEAEHAAVQQIVMTVGFWLAGKLRGRLKEPGIAAKFDPAVLAAREQELAVLAGLETKVRDGTASDVELESVPAKIEARWNADVELIKTLPENEPVRQELLDHLAAEKNELELRMARAGQETALSGPDAPSTFAPAEPGVILFAENGRPAIEKFHSDRHGSVTESTAKGVPEGTLEATLPNGEVTVYVPAEPQSGEPPKPLVVESSADEAIREADLDNVARTGLANLRGLLSGGNVRSVLANGGVQNVAGLLRLLARTEFGPVTPGGTRAFVVSKNNIELLSRSTEFRDFTGAYGPRLAFALKSKLKASANLMTPKLRAGLERATALIEQAPAPARQALIDSMIASNPTQLQTLLGVAKAKAIRPSAADILHGGVDRGSTQWLNVYQGELAVAEPRGSMGQAEYDAMIRARADVEQQLERARLLHFKKLSFEHKLAVLNLFDANGNTGRIGGFQGKFGAMAEWLFLPNRRNGKVWYLIEKEQTANVSGSTEPDSYEVANGVGTMVELKAHRLHLEIQDGRFRSIANEHYQDIMGVPGQTNSGDISNMPAGTIFEIWYLQRPAQSHIDVMMEVFNQPGSRIARIRFGKDYVIPVVPRQL